MKLCIFSMVSWTLISLGSSMGRARVLRSELGKVGKMCLQATLEESILSNSMGILKMRKVIGIIQ